VSENGQIPLVLIHGAWLSARSWENYDDYFGRRGFAVSAPEWPRKHGDAEEMRETADDSAGVGVEEIVDYYAALIGELAQPPVLIGHSYSRPMRGRPPMSAMRSRKPGRSSTRPDSRTSTCIHRRRFTSRTPIAPRF
jgi:pimeloyl-ACP methyl ester carboxylesterase